MTARETELLEKYAERRLKSTDRLKIQSSRINPLTHPASDNEVELQRPQKNVILATKRRSGCQRKLRNRVIKK